MKKMMWIVAFVFSAALASVVCAQSATETKQDAKAPAAAAAPAAPAAAVKSEQAPAAKDQAAADQNQEDEWFDTEAGSEAPAADAGATK